LLHTVVGVEIGTLLIIGGWVRLHCLPSPALPPPPALSPSLPLPLPCPPPLPPPSPAPSFALSAAASHRSVFAWSPGRSCSALMEAAAPTALASTLGSTRPACSTVGGLLACVLASVVWLCVLLGVLPLPGPCVLPAAGLQAAAAPPGHTAGAWADSSACAVSILMPQQRRPCSFGPRHKH
jgi:hypothetical protein